MPVFDAILRRFKANPSMSSSVYDPTPVAGDAFDMANMVEAADAKVLTAAERASITRSDGLTEDTTVNFVATDTATEIQALIDAQPKNLNGYSLTFQFADGTYTLDASLAFSYFYSGIVNIYGNATDNSLSTSKSVILDSTSCYTNGIESLYSTATMVIKYLQINFISSFDGSGIFAYSLLHLDVCDNYFVGSTTNNGYGVKASRVASCFIMECYVSNVQYGLESLTSRIHSDNNDDNSATGTTPLYGLRASKAGIIGKYGTQPSGSIANELTDSGGIIRA